MEQPQNNDVQKLITDLENENEALKKLLERVNERLDQLQNLYQDSQAKLIDMAENERDYLSEISELKNKLAIFEKEEVQKDSPSLRDFLHKFRRK